MSGFRINYSRVISQANEINDLSSELSREISKLENMMNDVNSNWKGPASDTYQKQLSKLISSMKNTKSKMASVSQTIKTVAKRIQTEDEKAAEKAKKLK